MAVGEHELAPRGQGVHERCGRTLRERLEAPSSTHAVGVACGPRLPERFACSIRTPHRAENRCESLLRMPATNRSLCEARRRAGKMGSLGRARSGIRRERVVKAPVYQHLSKSRPCVRVRNAVQTSCGRRRCKLCQAPPPAASELGSGCGRSAKKKSLISGCVGRRGVCRQCELAVACL